MPTARPRLSFRSFLAHAALVTASVLLALVLAEGMLRLFPALGGLRNTPNEKALFTLYDRQLGWAPRPSVSGIHRDDGFSVFVSQNAWGLRGPEDAGPRRRDASRRRVLVLGDSYVWGYGATQRDLFTDRRIDGSDVELLNFGVSGYGTDQELLLYRRLGAGFDVDEVVLVFTPYNDVENNLMPEQYGYAKPYFVLDAKGSLRLHQEQLRESRWERALENLLFESRAINLLVGGGLRVRNVLLNRFATPLGPEEARNRVLRSADLSARDRAGLQLTVALIRTLRDETEGHGARFSVVFVPYKPHILAGEPDNHPFVPLLAAALSADGIPYYEPYPVFLRESRTGPPLFNSLDNHFSAAGHRLFARLFTDPGVCRETLDLYGVGSDRATEANGGLPAVPRHREVNGRQARGSLPKTPTTDPTLDGRGLSGSRGHAHPRLPSR